jgi:hypothetical protein
MTTEEGRELGIIFLVLIFAGAGISLLSFWIVAGVLLVIWLLGFVVRGADHSWYRVTRRCEALSNKRLCCSCPSQGNRIRPMTFRRVDT